MRSSNAWITASAPADRYDYGLVAYYEVIDGQRTLQRAEQESTRIQGERFLATVMLIKALQRLVRSAPPALRALVWTETALLDEWMKNGVVIRAGFHLPVDLSIFCTLTPFSA